MKRALAKRAKSQRVEQHRSVVTSPPLNGGDICVPPNHTSTDNDATTTHGPPRKLQRRNSPLLSPPPAPQSSSPVSFTKNHCTPQQQQTPKVATSATPQQPDSISSQEKTRQSDKGRQGPGRPSTKTNNRIRADAAPLSSSSALETPISAPISSSSRGGIGSRRPSSSSTTPKKRLRPGISTTPLETIPSDDDMDDDNKNSDKGFYLKHQNRALTSELHNFKHSIFRLESERDVRRVECERMHHTLGNMEVCWREMEVVLLAGLNDWKVRELDKTKKNKNSLSNIDSIACASTGSGESVETISAALNTLASLSKSTVIPSFPIPENGNGADTSNSPTVNPVEDKYYEHYLNSLSNATKSFSDRCSRFQQLLLDLVQHLWSHSISDKGHLQKRQEKIFNAGSLNKKIAKLEMNCSELENRVKELAKVRDDANASERRVRKGLYRLASGRLKIDEVLKSVEEEGSSSLQDFSDLQEEASQNSQLKGENFTKKNDSSPADENDTAGTVETVKPMELDGKIVTLDDVVEMKKKIVDLGLIADSREGQVNKLLKEKENAEERVNKLLSDTEKVKAKNSLKDEEIKKSTLFLEISSKYTALERESKSLKNSLASVKERWAMTKGDLDHVRKTVTGLTEKHNRRLRELAGESIVPKNGEASKPETSAVHSNFFDNGKKIIELEHKLKHALDNVRQSEVVRLSLKEVNILNGELQNRIEQLKAENTSLNESMNEQKLKSDEQSPFNTPHKENRDTPSKEHSYSSASSQDKVRSLKKCYAAAVSSKEAAKAKQERAEKEKDSLMKSNTRLIQQIQEKDDMNAKSLSTILHLKQLSEQLEQERDILKKKLKGTQQLEIAARLAGNAKDRVEEEALREKEAAVEELKQATTKLESLMKEKDEADRLLSESKTEIAAVNESLHKIQARCNQLVKSSTEIEREKKKANELLVVAQKEAEEATKKAETATAASKKGKKFASEFTAEDLTKQVDHLKSRLACPVCNHRDKAVILMRCRHMFCQQCVDINIKNRSRKCPACAQRFDMKDVQDVWL